MRENASRTRAETVLFGLTFEKLLVLALIAAFLIGPDRLPVYSAKLAQFVRAVKAMADGARERVRQEMGPDFEDVDWKRLDPRQYDPRRILRDALLEDDPSPRRPTRPVIRSEIEARSLPKPSAEEAGD
jgi:sec-independent protein translocase protein TatB